MFTSKKQLSHEASTLIGMSAILMWSATITLFRRVSEIFSPIGGAALIFTVGAILACSVLGFPKVKRISKAYLWLGGLLFVTYEIFMSLSIGFANNRAQALELGMINYLWPSLTVVFAILMRQQKGSWLFAPAIGICFLGIVWVIKGNAPWSADLLWQNIQSNPLAYFLAFSAAFLWAIYSVITRRFGNGENGVPLFLAATAFILWIQYAISNEPTLGFDLKGLEQVMLSGALMATAYSCWNHGIQHGNIMLMAVMSYFAPILSGLLTSVWLDLSPSPQFFYGVLMVTTGSLACWWIARK